MRRISKPYREASRRYGVPVLPTFFHYASQGDLCLLCDHPEVMPVGQLRPQDQYTGALIWHRDAPLPAELADRSGGVKLVYITVGTQESMSVQFLEALLRRLIQDGYRVVLSKGNRDFPVEFVHERLFVYSFINESALLPKVDLWIYHGSAMSTYNGLYHGVPMISLPVQADQHFHSESLQRLKLGELVRPSALRIDELSDLASQMIADDAKRKRCQKFAEKIQSLDARNEVVERISTLLHGANE